MIRSLFCTLILDAFVYLLDPVIYIDTSNYFDNNKIISAEIVYEKPALFDLRSFSDVFSFRCLKYKVRELEISIEK